MDTKNLIDTKDLIDFARNMIENLYDGPADNKESIACAQTYALIAIAIELKRKNDFADDIYTAELNRQL